MKDLQIAQFLDHTTLKLQSPADTLGQANESQAVLVHGGGCAGAGQQKSGCAAATGVSPCSH